MPATYQSSKRVNRITSTKFRCKIRVRNASNEFERKIEVSKHEKCEEEMGRGRDGLWGPEEGHFKLQFIPNELMVEKND